MKLLHIIRSTDLRGGGPIEAIRQANTALAPLGHTNEILSADPPDAPWLGDHEIPIHALGPGISKIAYAPRMKAWLRQNLRKYDCAIIHSLWLYPGHVTSDVCHELSVPYFVYTHGTLDPQFKSVFPLKHLQKAVLWAIRERRMLERANAVLFTCDIEQELGRRTFWPPMRTNNSAILPYCTGAPPLEETRQRRAFEDQFPDLANRRFLLFLSRLHPKKGCDIAIRAFEAIAANFPDVSLVLAGPNRHANYTSKIQQMAKSSAYHDRIFFTGMLAGDVKWGAFRKADAFILPSHQENFGIAVVEALACKLPVLITDRINIHSTISKYRCGIVGTNTDESTIAILRSWLSLDSAERDKMRAAAIECFESEFSISRVAPLWVSTLSKFGVQNGR